MVNLRGPHQRCVVFVICLIVGGGIVSIGIQTGSLQTIANLIGNHGDDPLPQLSVMSLLVKNSRIDDEGQRGISSEMRTNNRSDEAWFKRRVVELTKERDEAASSFAARNNSSGGFLWFYHNQKAGGTTLCSVLQNALKNQTRTKSCYLKDKNPDVWTGLQYESFNGGGVPIREKWKLNATAPPDDEVQFILQTIENEMKSMGRSMVSSENLFIPRSILHKWIVEGNPFYTQLFSKWSFVTTVRDPVKRLESSFYFHDDHFRECGEHNYGLNSCIQKTKRFMEGHHRNKLVKELSGFFSPTESGDPGGGYINGVKPMEATEWDLTVAKLVLHRFLPPIVADGTNIMASTMYKTLSLLNLTREQMANKKENKGKKKKVEMSRETIMAIQKLNALDVALYKYALANFDIPK